MSKVVVIMSMSLDGFVADADDGVAVPVEAVPPPTADRLVDDTD